MKQVITLLSQNNAQGKEMRAMLGAILDKIQIRYPQYTQQCREARTFLQKLKEGLFNTSSVISGTSLFLSLKAGASAGAAAGTAVAGPVGTAVGGGLGALLVPLMIIGSNLAKSLSKA